MAISYLIKIDPDVLSQDIPSLPDELKDDFYKIFKPVLSIDPQKCDGLPCHFLRGKLKGWKALDIEYEGDPNGFRLVYKIFDKPSPKHVKIISFGKHNPAYDKAKQRLGKKIT